MNFIGVVAFALLLRQSPLEVAGTALHYRARSQTFTAAFDRHQNTKGGDKEHNVPPSPRRRSKLGRSPKRGKSREGGEGARVEEILIYLI